MKSVNSDSASYSRKSIYAAPTLLILYFRLILSHLHWGGMIFLGEKQALGKLCQIIAVPQLQNFTLKCGFLTWRRASENFKCYPKMGKKWFLEPAPVSTAFFYCFKSQI